MTELKTSLWVVEGTLCLGLFMIGMDTMIVAVANPAIMASLQTDISNVIWVTSAYLLAFAVPLLITGRLGDRFGPRRLYLTGLTVFTLASLWCGLSTGIGTLIAARTVQGVGAALIMPQTMTVITRIFPPANRGAAMGVWSATAGIATLVGPIAGGALVDHLGWGWIFFINIPIGLTAIALAVRYVPELPTREHRFDIPGVLLSAIGMLLLVFGIQEGNKLHWSEPVWIMIVAGVAVLVGFVYSQYRPTREPLIPLSLFRLRNFALANVGTGAMQAAMAALTLPAFFYLQTVRDISPTKSALVFAPMAIVVGVLAPAIGRLADRTHPRYLPAFGFGTLMVCVVGITVLMDSSTPMWQLVLLIALMGASMSCIGAPLGAIATRDLPIHQAGAGSGIYGATGQAGSVLGSAAISALISTRMTAHGINPAANEVQAGALPALLRAPFSAALAQSMLLAAGLLGVGFLASVLFGTRAEDERAVAALQAVQS